MTVPNQFARSPASSRPSLLHQLERLVRWREWYNSKLPMFLIAALYAGLAGLGRNQVTLSGMAWLIVGLSLFAAFGHLINDYADRDADRAAGKYRPLAHWPTPAAAAFVLAVGAAAELTVACVFDPVAASLMGVAIVIGFAYSAPPLRLKERGLWGWATAAIAQRTLPTVIAFAAMHCWDLAAVSYCVLVTLIGLRFIAVHQLQDRLDDKRAGLRTAGTENDPATLVAWLHGLLAAEIVALIGAVALMSLRAPLLALAGGGYAAWVIARRVRGTPILPTDFFVLSEFYHIIWPLALAVSLGAKQPVFLWMVPLALALCWTQLVAVIHLRIPQQTTATSHARKAPSKPIDRARVQRAIDAGLAALARMQALDGSFPLSTGTREWRSCSPLFSTAYIMLGAGRVLSLEARSRAVDYLRRERRDRLWEFDPAENLPADVDSTACAMAALALNGATDVVTDGAALLRGFWRQDTGPFQTWLTPGPLSAPERDDAVVNCNVLLALRVLRADPTEREIEAACRLVRRSVRGSRYYSVPATMAHAAARAGLPLDCLPPVAAAVPGPDDVLACAQWLCAFPLGSDHLVEAILRAQEPDGTWPIRPWVTGAGNPQPYWGSSAVSSALAVEALLAWEQGESWPGNS